jgi:Flp pilus assembly protein TadG
MRRTYTLVCKWQQDDEGANLVEAALILPVILWVLFAVIEFSGILYAQMALQNGVSLAARYAITRTVVAGVSREDSIRAVLKQETPTLKVKDGDISFSHIPAGSSTWAAGTGGPSEVEKISATYTWPLMTPFMKQIFGTNSITIRSESAMKNESDLSQ